MVSTRNHTDDPAAWDPNTRTKIVISCTVDERARIIAAMKAAGGGNLSAYIIKCALVPSIKTELTAAVKAACEEVLQPHRDASNILFSQILNEQKALRREIAELKKE